MATKWSLNGWRRLWIVVSGVALLYAIFWGFGNVSSTAYRIDDKIISGFSDPTCREVVHMRAGSKLSPEPEYEHPCWPLYIYRHIYENAATTRDGYIKHIEGRHREALLISQGIALVLWLVGVALLYGAGFIVAWVRKGFRGPSKT